MICEDRKLEKENIVTLSYFEEELFHKPEGFVEEKRKENESAPFFCEG